MSRIGNLPIPIPAGLTLDLGTKNQVKVKGAQGEQIIHLDPDITVEEKEGQLVVKRPSDQKRHKAFHGLYRALINNAIIGVTEGYKKELELIGVGYRVTNTGNLLEIMVGYSHPIYFIAPKEVKVTTVSEKGKPPTIILESADKQLIGQVAAKIRAFRKPEPYKGKGIKFKGEVLRRKAGKTVAS